mgnify:FL=1|tara:strand:- start:689 stop:1027 length:339 start_codon:yes stop_codon:yes gene_type:complete
MPESMQLPDSPRAGSAKDLLAKFENLSPASSPKRGSATPKPPKKDIGVSLVSSNPYLAQDRKDKRAAMNVFQKMHDFCTKTVVGQVALAAAVAGLSLAILPSIYFGKAWPWE